MSRLPTGEHLVCITATEPARTKSGDGGFIAVTLECLSGPHVGKIHIDRLNVMHKNERVVGIALQRLTEYAQAVGIDPKKLKDPDMLKGAPFIVKVSPQKNDPDNREVKSVKPCPLEWKANAEALCKQLADRAPTPPPPPGSPQAGSPAGGFDIVTVSSVDAERIDWLWLERFALGKLSIITGDPGLGKSQLSLFMAAKVTTGGAWPNGEGCAPVGHVLLMSCEDGVGDTIRPRLEAAGADLDRVHVVKAVEEDDGKRRMFNLQSDLAKLEATVIRARAAGVDIKLVIIDPISAYMGGGTDTHKQSDVRAVLDPVSELAEKLDVAIVCVAHPSKVVAGGKGVNAVGGSQAFVAVARVAWLLSKEIEQGEKGERIETGRVLMLEGKKNIGKKVSGLALRIESRDVPTKQGVVSAPLVVFDGEVDTTADDALRQEGGMGLGVNKLDKAKAFLKAQLSGGNVDASTLAEAGRAEGLTERTLQRAAKEMGVLKSKSSFGSGWVWGYATESEFTAMFQGLPR